MTRPRFLAFLVLSLSCARASAAVLPSVPAGLTGIGVAAAVRGAVRASAPGQPAGRIVESGKPVYLNDHVTTGPDGRLQILLFDETTFTVGPNSDMVLDEFVYDPASGAGKVSASIAKGAFRFVTGKVAQRKSSDMKVSLPVGTIGIRGTIVVGRVDGSDAEIVLSGPGPQNNAQERVGGITVSNEHGSVDIDVGGYGTTIRGGGAPSDAVLFTPDQMEGLTAPLAPKQTQASRGGGVEGTDTATSSSGQGTASGGVNLQTSAADLVAASNDTSSFAAQQAAASLITFNDQSSWADILAIPNGTGEYSGDGDYVGSMSHEIVTGTFNFTVAVNFGAQTIGGLNSNISFLTGPFSCSQGINIVNYGSMPPGAPAVYTFTGADLSAPAPGSFAGSSVEFHNDGSHPAGTAVMNMVYTDSLDTAAGKVAAPLGPIPPM